MSLFIYVHTELFCRSLFTVIDLFCRSLFIRVYVSFHKFGIPELWKRVVGSISWCSNIWLRPNRDLHIWKETYKRLVHMWKETYKRNLHICMKESRWVYIMMLLSCIYVDFFCRSLFICVQVFFVGLFSYMQVSFGSQS